MANESEVLGIDIGGSGIKSAPVDLNTGEMTAERFRLDTPIPATPELWQEKSSRYVNISSGKARLAVVFRVSSSMGWSIPLPTSMRTGSSWMPKPFYEKPLTAMSV